MTDSGNNEPAYSFHDWDREQFQRAANVLTSIAVRADAVRSARRAILELYFKDTGIEQ